MSEKTWYLKQCKLFQRLDSDEIAAVESSGRIREFPTESPIYLPAQRADAESC